MPDIVTNELIYEVLKSMQANDAIMREDIHTLKLRVTSIDNKLALANIDIAHLSERMDRVDIRMERIENRLNLTERV